MWKDDISNFLQYYRLKLNSNRSNIYPTNIGYRFLGQVVFQTHRRLTSENVRKFKKHKRRWEKNPPSNLKQRIASWVGHASQADTYFLLK